MTWIDPTSGPQADMDAEHIRRAFESLSASLQGMERLLDYAVLRDGSTDTTLSTTSTTPVDADATNLRVTFTAPPSGNVRIVRNAWVDADPDPVLESALFGVRDLSDAAVAEALETVFQGSTVGGYDPPRVSGDAIITGLTPGNEYTWKWTYYCANGVGSVYLYHGPTYGPLEFKVYALPF